MWKEASKHILVSVDLKVSLSKETIEPALINTYITQP